MKAIAILFGIVLSICDIAQGLGPRTRSASLATRNALDRNKDFGSSARGYAYRNAIVPNLAAREELDLYDDYEDLLARHAEADLMAGLKKMVASGLKTHGPKITKFAHEKLQEQLKKFVPLGGKGKSKDKAKDKSKDGGKEKKDGKAEKTLGGKEKGNGNQSRDLTGGMQAAPYYDDWKTRGGNVLETLMTVHDMAERAASYMNPDMSIWDYD